MVMETTLIRNGRIVDGSGSPWFYADVALTGGRISAVAPPGRLDPQEAREVVDAQGHVVCPGFIDIQSHAVVPLMVDGRCLSKITQGVTTEIMGEAWTPAPALGQFTDPMAHGFFSLDVGEWEQRAQGWRRFRDWPEAMVEHGVSPNIGSFLGGGTLRHIAKGLEMGLPTQEELALMQRVMAECMDDGAFGVSYALIYPPDAYCETEELIAVCRAMRPANGLYITHIRSESDQLLEALEEAIEIGRAAGVPVEIYHLKASGSHNWSKMEQVIQRIHQVRAEGLDITADMYPYVASGTGLSSVLPTWVAADGKFFQNLTDPAVRARIKEECFYPAGDWEAMVSSAGPESVMPIGFKQAENQIYVGRRLNEIADMRGQDWVDAAMDLLLSEGQRIGTIYFKMSEENVQRQLQQPWIKISTDAGGYDPAWAAELGPVHPRAYGTYPRVLGKYVREEGILPLEDAVRKMTSAVALRLGLGDRGLLREGLAADVVIFDSETVGDRATFAQSHALSTGVRDVWVNGVAVLRNGVHTGATPGQYVTGSGRPA